MLAGPPAACFLKLGLPEKALEDADKCLSLQPDFVKGRFRRGVALVGLNRFQEAAAVPPCPLSNPCHCTSTLPPVFSLSPLFSIGLPLRTTFPARDADVQVRQQGSL